MSDDGAGESWFAVHIHDHLGWHCAVVQARTTGDAAVIFADRLRAERGVEALGWDEMRTIRLSGATKPLRMLLDDAGTFDPWGALSDDGVHTYLSTKCLSAGRKDLNTEGHRYCQGGVRQDGGAKVPGVCKCHGSPCVCPCHAAAPG